ncbi:hypothetical protein LQ318_08540 [Aliifodinibius salicampi]|uniref:Uncharacterized protein n=1 Tax=Fodinibius salicampi TaxID=1920655 RepID=A0ABT3PYS6_9BACT|nr:hypothetical protein [Fodinibius salicampi]
MKISVLWGILIICFVSSLSAQETGNYSSEFLVCGYPDTFKLDLTALSWKWIAH